MTTKTAGMLHPAATHLRRSAWLCGHRARQDCDGSIAVICALTAPLLVLVLGLGIDVSYWMAARLELQRMADVAAMAGAANYASKTLASSALTTAANVAELNGFPADPRTTGTNSLSESDSVWSGYFTSNSIAQLVTVSLQRQVTTFFSGAVLTSNPVISVTATAQLVPRSNVGQACVLALQGYSTGVTTPTDLSAGGNVNISLSGCDLRADASMTFNGNATVNAANVIASGTIDNGKLCTPPYSCQQPQIPDPFAGTYGSLLAFPTLTGTQTSSTALPGYNATVLSTGVYYVSSSVIFNGGSTITVQPGIYYVNGGVTFNGGSNVAANGVTIINNNSIIVDGNATLTLTAPTTGPSAGLIFATSGSLTFNGNPNVAMQGAIYAPTPNGQVIIDGNFNTVTNPCLTIVAYTVTFNGNSSLSNAGCAGMGVPSIADQPEIARLIQ